MQCIFHISYGKKYTVFRRIWINVGYCLYHYSRHMIAEFFFETNEAEKQTVTTFCASLPKKEVSRDSNQKRKKLLIWNYHVTMTKRKTSCDFEQKEANISNNGQRQSHCLTFVVKNESILSASIVLSQRPNFMTYNTTTSLDKLTCTNYVTFGKCQDKFGQFSLSKWIPITCM